MNGRSIRFAVAWLISAGIGCTSSAPVRYYTLTPPSDKTLPASITALAIDVRVVHIPAQLNRAEMMVRTGPTEVTLLDNERWASPVNDEIKDAVHLELARRFSLMNGPPAFAKLMLDIDIRHLEAELGRYALLEVSWRATLSGGERQPNGARTTTCAFRVREEIHTGYAGMVEGYQREIAALADSIAAELTSPASGVDAPCQKFIEGSAGGPASIGH